jgi:diguanylate cyclase (GGDEF)-like protein
VTDSTESEQAAAEMRRLIAEVWDQERAGVLAGVDVLEEAIAAAEAGELGEELALGARREAHKLAGSVGTFGFEASSQRAREVERGLEVPPREGSDELARLAELVSAIRGDLEAEPAAAVEAEPAAAADTEIEPAKPVDLLLVVDDSELAEAITAEAGARGLSWSVAAEPASARELIDNRSPALVLLDFAAGDGSQPALELLGEVSGDRPVVVLTGEGVADRVEVARRGGRGFLSRELAPKELIDAVLALRERLRTAGTRVLALDDDPLVRRSVAALLGAAGLEVATCGDPASFWEELELHPPDLVMLDYDMPEVEGPEMCRALRNDRRWETMPVLFLTSRTDPDSIRRVFAAGADDYISKPFVGPELLGRIANRLDRVRMMRTLADTDPLTGLFNRRRSQETLEPLCAMARRFDQPFSLAVLDVDKFKLVNDSGGGHAAGDEVLRAIGAALMRTFRAEDVAARWGGDEFVVGMYGMAIADGRERLGRFLEQLRKGPLAAGLKVTMSAGLATSPTDGEDLDALYRAADEALYRAKEAGGNRLAAGASLDDDLVDIAIVAKTALDPTVEQALETRGYSTIRIAAGDSVEGARRVVNGDDADLAEILARVRGEIDA